MAIEDRLESLERSCRRWRVVGISAGSIGLIAVLVVIIRQGDTTKNLRVERLAVVDANHQEIVVIGINEDQGKPSIAIRDESGKSRILLGFDPSSNPAINMIDPDGLIRFLLSADPKTGPAAYFRDRKPSEAGILIGADSAGLSAIGLFDREGVSRVEIAVNPDGTPGLKLLNEQHQPLIHLP